MLILLIPAVLVALFLYLLGAEDHPSDDLHPWQGEFLIAAAVWGALLVAITEGLNFFYAINRLWLAICWGIVLVAGIAKSWRSGRFSLGCQLCMYNNCKFQY